MRICKIPLVTRALTYSKKAWQWLNSIMTDWLCLYLILHFLKVQKWIRPSVNQRNARQGGPAMHIHKAELTRVLARAGTPYSSANYSTLCSGINGASDDFRSSFGKSHRELWIKIPREAVNKDQLKIIDSCEYTWYSKISKFLVKTSAWLYFSVPKRLS